MCGTARVLLIIVRPYVWGWGVWDFLTLHAFAPSHQVDSWCKEVCGKFAGCALEFSMINRRMCDAFGAKSSKQQCVQYGKANGRTVRTVRAEGERSTLAGRGVPRCVFPEQREHLHDSNLLRVLLVGIFEHVLNTRRRPSQVLRTASAGVQG